MKYTCSYKTLLNLIGFLFILSFAGCAATGGGAHVDWENKPKKVAHPKIKTKKAGPPPHAPAHGYRAKYNYHYYPHSSVYFDTHRKVYFYLEGNTWRMSVSLPQAIYVELGEHVSIEMDIDKPYTHYKEHRHQYPPGQLKKKGKKKWVN